MTVLILCRTVVSELVDDLGCNEQPATGQVNLVPNAPTSILKAMVLIPPLNTLATQCMQVASISITKTRYVI